MFNDKFSSIRSFLRCPYCTSCFSIEESYQIHMLKENVTCSVKECGNIVTFDALTIASLIKLYNDGRLGRITSFSSTLEFHASRNTWETFDSYVRQLVQKEVAASPRRASLSLHMRRQFSTIKKIACITLSPIFSSDLVQGKCIHTSYPHIYAQCITLFLYGVCMYVCRYAQTLGVSCSCLQERGVLARRSRVGCVDRALLPLHATEAAAATTITCYYYSNK